MGGGVILSDIKEDGQDLSFDLFKVAYDAYKHAFPSHLKLGGLRLVTGTSSSIVCGMQSFVLHVLPKFLPWLLLVLQLVNLKELFVFHYCLTLVALLFRCLTCCC